MRSSLKLGVRGAIDGADRGAFELPVDDLLTHCVITGMTGTGKTGLLIVLVEEALRARIPVLLIDVKGDLPNLKLAFPSFDPEEMKPWVEAARGDEDGVADLPLVAAATERRKSELAKWSIAEPELTDLLNSSHIRILTPGGDAGEPIHLLSALERRSARWDDHLDGARDTLSAAVSLLLRLVGRDPDPGQSREHALLSVLAERRHRSGSPANLAALLEDVLDPPLRPLGPFRSTSISGKPGAASSPLTSTTSSRPRRSRPGGKARTWMSQAGCPPSKARRRRRS
ncbi:MAG: DUF853 family protein [Deltaproteobacteria bacterium]|nr:DUF853 family protein [Deltaproteobacteria bacterium]